MSRNKIIVILGPTASGKSDLAVKLARKFNGEIVSADSRQVYKGMDIGTGKITKKEMQGIPHYLLDVVSPKTRFSVANYQKLAFKVIRQILEKRKTPFLAGGTGFYIQAVVDGILMPKVKPDWNLRKKLEKKPVSELYKMLVKLDPNRAANIDKNNPRRIIRALEIVLKTKSPVPPLAPQKTQFKALFLGVKKEPKELKRLIEKRLLKRLKNGMVEEIRKLHPVKCRKAAISSKTKLFNRVNRSGVSWKRLEEFGLEYRFIAQYLQGKLNYDEMVQKLQKEIEHYAKRQMTWFKRDKRIKWVKNYKQTEKLVRNFLKCY